MRRQSWAQCALLTVMLVVAVGAPTALAAPSGPPEPGPTRAQILIADRFDDHGNRSLSMTIGLANNDSEARLVRVDINSALLAATVYTVAEIPAWLGVTQGLPSSQVRLEGTIPPAATGRVVLTATYVQVSESPFVSIAVDGATLGEVAATAELTCSPATARFDADNTYLEIVSDSAQIKWQPRRPGGSDTNTVRFEQTGAQSAVFGDSAVVSLSCRVVRPRTSAWRWPVISLLAVVGVGYAAFRLGLSESTAPK